jgi:hydroxymethylpyrimidine pyrophosphatase-like HAD family hydrolase
LSSLPRSLSTLKLSTDIDGAAANLDLMVASMRLIGALGTAAAIDPGRPKVSAAGRRLYHLSWSKSLPPHESKSKPYKVKALAAGGPLRPGSSDEEEWKSLYLRWIQRLSRLVITGVVLDYDGTCVSTRNRFSPPAAELRAEIVGLLDAGLSLGIATGRGHSVLETARSWLPTHLWPRVTVGMYNGAYIQQLNEDFERRSGSYAVLEAVASALDVSLVGDHWAITRRPWQVTVETRSASVESAASAVRAIIERVDPNNVRVESSGHSIDIVLRTSSKSNVARQLDSGDGGEILAIGDQGQPGGNDFELLALGPASLSVDRVSGDPDRCWNLSTGTTRGPDLLVKYLRALTTHEGTTRFRWPVDGSSIG